MPVVGGGDHLALIAMLLLVPACDRTPGGDTRTLRLRGLPLCARGVAYARPVVVRLDRNAAIFEEKYFASTTVEGGHPTASMPVARQRMRSTVRIGLCRPTSLATWDCTAATWVSAKELFLDARSDVVDVDLPPFEVPCADGSTAGKNPRPHPPPSATHEAR